MRNRLFGLSTILILALFIWKPFNKDPKEKEALINEAVRSYLSQVHFSPQELDDSFSVHAFNIYLNYLDGNKRFITEEEVEQLKKSEQLIDDQFANNELIFFDEANSLMETAIQRAEDIFKETINHTFDFDKKENLELDPDKRGFASNVEELKEYWRKSLKYEILIKWDDLVSDQEKRQKRLAEGKGNAKDSVAVVKTEEEFLKEAKEDVKDNFEKWFKRLGQLRRSDRFESYINSIVHVYDPHTSYFNPKEKEDFDLRMSGKLEGIGARLSSNGEYTKVVSVVPGGPAWKTKEIQAEDIITHVAQDGEPPVLVEGMRIDDVVSKIRGKKGSVVILTIKKQDGSVKDVRIVRDVVVTEDGRASSLIVDAKEVGKKIGYIYLPSFYADFNDQDGRSCAVDIEKELEKLKKEQVDGIIMDIRGNGGGSLRDVVDMSGLFIEKGPIVQVKPRGRSPHVLEDEDATVQYNGPLIVMVNNYSVSASEILAAALQDYRRAIIVGTQSTFGKGTVQRFFDLDRGIRGANDLKPLGNLKMTIQKFYRIDGSSTQLKGVVPDIILPDSYDLVRKGEKDYDYPLPFTQIDEVRYGQNAYVVDNYNTLRSRSVERVAQVSDFDLIKENAKRIKDNKSNRNFNLNKTDFREKLRIEEENVERFKDIMKDTLEGFSLSNLAADLEYIEADSSRIARNEDFIKGLSKDIYLEETLNIMNDMIELKK